VISRDFKLRGTTLHIADVLEAKRLPMERKKEKTTRRTATSIYLGHMLKAQISPNVFANLHKGFINERWLKKMLSLRQNHLATKYAGRRII
jgi:hypothetical protein